MSEEPIKPNPSPEQYAALQEELQKLKNDAWMKWGSN